MANRVERLQRRLISQFSAAQAQGQVLTSVRQVLRIVCATGVWEPADF